MKKRKDILLPIPQDPEYEAFCDRLRQAKKETKPIPLKKKKQSKPTKERVRGPNSTGKIKKAVNQHGMDNLFIRAFDTLNSTKKAGFNPPSVAKAARSGKPYAGYIWEFQDVRDEGDWYRTTPITKEWGG